MAQWIKTLITMADDLSSILNFYMAERTDPHAFSASTYKVNK